MTNNNKWQTGPPPEIKPCPRCGWEPTVSGFVHTDGVVYCNACDFSVFDSDRTAAINEWNKRVDPSPLFVTIKLPKGLSHEHEDRLLESLRPIQKRISKANDKDIPFLLLPDGFDAQVHHGIPNQENESTDISD